MIALPNPYAKMELTQEQYDSLLANYVEMLVDSMDMDTLVQFASEQIEMNLRESYSLPEELCEEIASLYDQDVLNDLLDSVKNVDS